MSSSFLDHIQSICIKYYFFIYFINSINIFLSDCTTYRLSYFENDLKSLIPPQKYTPVRSCRTSDIPFESDTTMQLSYQPVESLVPVEKPWAEKPPYQLPVIPMEDNTTYNTRFLILFKLFISSSDQFTLSQTKIKKLILFDIYKMLQLNILILSIYNI